MDIIEQADAAMCETACLPKYCLCSTIGELTDEIKRLRKQVEKALPALKEIADKESWHCCSVSRSMKGIAIAALEKIEESE